MNNDTDPLSDNIILNNHEANSNYRRRPSWDGSESELVFDDDVRDFEENLAGIKLSYVLEKKDVLEFLKRNVSYRKNEKKKKKSTFWLSLIFFAFNLISLYSKNPLYALFSLVPLLTIVLLWLIPIISIKSTADHIYDPLAFDVEIFHDKIEILHSNIKKVFPLDETGKYDITENLIIIYSKNNDSLIIPLRTIEPDCLPDVQAMIFAGSRPI